MLTSAVLIVSIAAKLVVGAADELHVATHGDDSNSGAPGRPLASVVEAVKRAAAGTTIIVHAGTYRVDELLRLENENVRIVGQGQPPPVIEHGDYEGKLFDVVARGARFENLVLDGRFATKARAIKGGREAHQLVVRNCEIKNFTRHAVDLDGADCVVENCHIHHILWWNEGERDDAHGIVCMFASNLLVRNCNVHHVSGDCFQCDRGKWQDLRIEDCEFWDGPLEADMAGFKKGDLAAENAVDTKLGMAKPRGRLVLKNSKFHGFRTKFIPVAAALNLKENIDVVVDGCEIRDSHVALRLRGHSKGAVMWPTIVNCVIRDCDLAVRHEDRLGNFRFAHNTIDSCVQIFARYPPRLPPGDHWIVANNLFLGAAALPEGAAGATNRALSADGLVDPKSLIPLSAARITGAPVEDALPGWYAGALAFDRMGATRSKTAPTMGAFEAAAPPRRK